MTIDELERTVGKMRELGVREFHTGDTHIVLGDLPTPEPSKLKELDDEEEYSEETQFMHGGIVPILRKV